MNRIFFVVLLATTTTILEAIRTDNTESRKENGPIYPKEFSQYQWDDPGHNRMRKKKLSEWGEQLIAESEEESFVEMRNEIKASLPQRRLEKWRTRLHERSDAQDNSILRNRARRRAIVSLQVGIAQSHDARAPNVNLESVAEAYGGEKVLRNTKKVSSLIRDISRLHIEDAEKSASFLETMERVSGSEAGYGSEPNVKCIMCLYLMEMTERDVGFPQRDFYSDAYPSYSSRNPGSPGPASYFRNFGGAVSQAPGSYNPIPGPGYSFLEMSEKNPTNAWSHYEDYSTLSTPAQNLHSRLLLEEALDAKHDQDLVRGPEKTVPDMETLYESAFESQYNLRGGGSSSRSSSKSNEKLAKSINDVLSLNSGTFSMLEMDENNKDLVVPTAFVETKFVGGLASAMGLTVCRPGKKYCRPKLKQPGRRQLERRVMMQAIKSEYATMQGMIEKSIMDTCGDMPKSFAFNCGGMLSNAHEIAKRYLHDYDDDEICTDLEFCTMKMLNVPQEPYVLKVPIP